MNGKPDKATKRKLVIDKARKLFWEKGYDETSMQDIARACKFEASNLYNYFENKEELLFNIILEQDRSVSSMVAAESQKSGKLSPREQLRLFITSYLNLAVKKFGPSGLLFDFEVRNLSPEHKKKCIELRDEFETILDDMIERGKKAGEFREVDTNMATLCIVSILIRTRLWYSPRGRLSIDDVSNFILDLILKGIDNDRSLT